ncbi:MAG: IclR family transcriptional regulator [Paracoccaceae bacterium]|nr:IclR family transcriptional regulator [Paracoccaceae bacterium]
MRVAPEAGTFKGVGLVRKAFLILDLFQPDRPNWSQKEVAEVTGMPKSTVNRLTRFLVSRGYLVQLPERNRYSLGAASIDLGRRASELFDFRDICRPMLERLSQETGETVLLTNLVGSGNAVRCVEQIESTREGLRVFEQIGNTFPLHAGAAPKAVLAALPDEAAERYLARPLQAITAKTLVEPAALRRDILETRGRGFSFSNGETYEGVAGIGAAFFWGNGSPAGSMAVALPVHRLTHRNYERFGALLELACHEVTDILAARRCDDPIRESV